MAVLPTAGWPYGANDAIGQAHSTPTDVGSMSWQPD